MLATVNSSNSGIRLFSSVRLDRVKLYVLADADDNYGSLDFTWTGDRNPNILETISYAPAVPTKLSFVPPEDSLARYWSVTGSDESEALFSISYDTTPLVIMDVHMTYIMAIGETTQVALDSVSMQNGVGYLALPKTQPIFEAQGLFVVTPN
jgi:hypothetical protein